MIKPIRNQVLVKAMKEDEVSAGGIIVPEHLRKDGAKVEIIAVGDGTPQKPMTLKPGMVGFRVDDWGIPIEDEGTTYYIMHQDAILATT